MKKHYLIFFLAILVQCSNFMGDDPTLYLEPENIIGEWVQISEVPSDVQGLYRKDTTVYLIGLDQLSDYIKFVDKNIYDPLTFKVIYQRGGTQYGYLERPEDNFRDFNDNSESILNYELNLGLPETTVLHQASFSVPRGCSYDTLRVTVDSDTIGLKRKGL
jgi:hypothetical protein